MNTALAASGLTIRVIPCLDIANGRVVKGTSFQNLRDAGDPVELAKRYCDDGADELVFLDITATKEDRSTLLSLVSRLADVVNIPFTVGGGIRTVEGAKSILDAGADKIAVNSAAVSDPALLARISRELGRANTVCAIDARRTSGRWTVLVRGGSVDTGIDAVSWAREAVANGAGELLVTSYDRDGTGSGFDTELLSAIKNAVQVPVIASGGAGSLQSFVNAVRVGSADAVLAASVFHFETFSIRDVKKALSDASLPIRPPVVSDSRTMKLDFAALNWQKNPDGLLPAIIQDSETGRVLMLGYMNEEALRKTLKSKKVTFFSRSKKRLWRKGEVSGNTLSVRSIVVDCDKDAILIQAIPKGPTCHTGNPSCFASEELAVETIGLLVRTIRDRSSSKKSSSYTKALLDGGVEAQVEKVLEEAGEVVQAARKEGRKRTIEEAADVLYHLLVLLRGEKIELRDIAKELRRRRK